MIPVLCTNNNWWSQLLPCPSWSVFERCILTYTNLGRLSSSSTSPVIWLEGISMSCIINAAASDFRRNSAHDSKMYVHPLIVYASRLTWYILYKDKRCLISNIGALFASAVGWRPYFWHSLGSWYSFRYPVYTRYIYMQTCNSKFYLQRQLHVNIITWIVGSLQ